MSDEVKKGDRYTWDTLDIEVLRVSKAAHWADIQVNAGHGGWTKRQVLPFPSTFKKYWSVA